MGKQKLVIDSPCIVTVTADGDEVNVEIETTRKSQAEKLHDTLIGHNRPFDSQRDLIDALREGDEFAGNKLDGMKVSMSKWFSGDKPITDRTLHAIAKAYRKRTGKVLDF